MVACQLLQVLSGITYGAGEIIGLELLADDYELSLPIGEQVRSSRGSIILQTGEVVPHGDNVTTNDVNAMSLVPQDNVSGSGLVFSSSGGIGRSGFFGSIGLFGSSGGEHAVGSNSACGLSTCSGNTYSISSGDGECAVVRSEAVGFTCTIISPDGFSGSGSSGLRSNTCGVRSNSSSGFHTQLDAPWVSLVSSSPSSNIRSECGFSGDPGSQQRLAVGIFAT